MNNQFTTKIILSIVVLPLLYLTGIQSYAQDTNEPNVTVIIYQDDNNNGAKDPDESNVGGFSLEVTGFNDQVIPFEETSTGAFVGYVPRRARIVVKGYSDGLLEGNVGEESTASVFFTEPGDDKVTYYVAISTGPIVNYQSSKIILPCYEGGPSEGKNGPAIISFGFMDDGIVQNLGGDAPNPSMLATVKEVGATWGIGLRHKANIVFAGALVKRHVGLGPEGIGGLYQYDLNSETLSGYDLDGIGAANGGVVDFGSLTRQSTDGPIAHDGSDDYTLTFMDQIATYDLDAFDKVGKQGIGDIDVSEDENTLWLVNLYNRSLVSVDVSSGEPNLNTVNEYSILDKVDFINLDMPYIRNINVGSQEAGGAEAFTDHNKIAWEMDQYGQGGTYGESDNNISNALNKTIGTTEANLYRSYRVGEDFNYSIPVPANGTYKVILHFAETDEKFIPSEESEMKERKFTIMAEGQTIMANYDIIDQASAANTANVEEFDVNVTDGTLNLGFLGQMVGNTMTPAMVSGIQIIGSDEIQTRSGELRPWGLTFHEGRGYLGLIADASISKSKYNLYGYIVSFNPQDMSEGFQLELEFPLNYKRERTSYADRTSSFPLRTSVWEAWVSDWEETGIELADDLDTMYLSYPQPIISDIDFDSKGNMVIGVMDRWGHQVGFLNYPAVSGNQTYIVGYSAGDILKAEPAGPIRADGNFILEPNNNDNTNFYNDDGPSFDGEFFYMDYFDSERASHGELFTGGLGVMPGRDEVVLTVFNPIRTGDNAFFDYDGVYTQGTHVYSTETGDRNRASLFVGQYQYGKASGLGDLEFGFDLPGNNIGNYVWCDGNGDGIQQADENGIPGVELSLVLVDEVNGNIVVQTTTTNQLGEYIFTNLQRNADYIIILDLNQPGLEGFRREASPPFQGTDPRLNSDGLDDQIPGYVVAYVQNLDLQYNYGFDFGLLGPESRDVTRTLCLEPGATTALFNLCEIDTAVKVPEAPDNIVEYYKTEADARLGINKIVREEGCFYRTSGETLVAKVYLPGDELCFSLSTVTLITTDVETNIELTGLACPGQPVNFNQLIQLNQDGLMVFTNPSMEPGDMIADISNYLIENFPATFYFKVSFDDTNCDAYGEITINTVPPFEIELEDQASICWGDLFYFRDLNITFPSGGSSISNLYWTTNGTGTFNSGPQFNNAQSYTPSIGDSIRGYVEFYLNASNYCYEEQVAVYLDILTAGEIRIECVATDTVYCTSDSIVNPYDPNFPKPKAIASCDYFVNPDLIFVEIDMDHCEPGNNVAGRIIRHWEFVFKDNFRAVCYDTIVVLMLPEAEVICPDSMAVVECEDIGEADMDENGNPLPYLTGIPLYDTIPLWPGLDTSLCGIYAEYKDDMYMPQCGGDTKMFRRLWTIYNKCRKDVITCEQWIVIQDTRAPLIRNNYEDFVEYDNDTVYVNTEDHECEALFYPSIWTTDLCAGVHSVKAVGEGLGAVELLPVGDSVWRAEKPIRIPMGYDPIRIEYTSSDSCWNMSTFVHYVKVKDLTPPTVASNKELKFVLQDKKGWMNAIDIDEGSWDNCGDVLILARRVDWDQFCVDLCTDEIANVTTLEELNKIDPFSVLDSGEVEKYYRGQIDWLLEDEACGAEVVEGWRQGIRSYWAANCGPVDEHGNPLIEVPQTFIGGGWSKKIPFGCEDVCQTIMVEILVMDQWCNWSKSWAAVYVEDAIPAKKLITLDDVSISCDAYAKYYKPVLDLASEAVSSDVDQAVFNHLDNLLGGYTIAWENDKGQPTDMAGQVLPEKFNVIDTYCEDTFKEVKYQDTLHDNRVVWKTRNVPVTYLSDISEDYKRGFVGVNCGATITQDIWPDLNDCGIGTIKRRFHVTTGCGEKQMTTTYIQTIHIEATCELSEDMFSWPEDTQVCLAITYNSKGNVNLPISLVGKVEYTFPAACRMIAVGYKDKVLNAEGSSMKKVVRTHSVLDWCTGETIDYDQIIVVTDTCENPDGEIMTLSGTIVDPYDNFIQNVTLNMESGQADKTSVLVEGGTYFMHVPENPNLVYLDKESSYRNGVSTLDLVWLQRYLKDPAVFDNSYQFIAADVNNNGLVEPLDLINIRELILGKKKVFFHVRPWQFVDVSTHKAFSRVGAKTMYQENNWVGVKMGDINFDSDYLIRSTSRSSQEVYPVVLEESIGNDGRIRMTVKMTEMIRLSGFQISLDMAGMTGWTISEERLDLTSDHWSVEGNYLNISWVSKEMDQVFTPGEELFVIVIDNPAENFDARNISLNPGDFASEVYTSDLESKSIGLRFQQKTDDLQHTLFPNPVDQFQVFDFYSPTATEAVITVHSIGGKEIESFKIDLQRGHTTHQHILSDSYNSGLYVYQIRTRDHIVTGRFEVIR